jgi:hypothetical protein
VQHSKTETSDGWSSSSKTEEIMTCTVAVVVEVVHPFLFHSAATALFQKEHIRRVRGTETKTAQHRTQEQLVMAVKKKKKILATMMATVDCVIELRAPRST